MRHRVTYTLCELSICRRCARELFGFIFDEKERLLGNPGCSSNTNKEVITNCTAIKKNKNSRRRKDRETNFREQ